MSEWQPIETAPKDGTDILLYLPGAAQCFSMIIGHWSACDELPDDDAWYPTTPHAADSLDIDPTHWMPLPKAPNIIDIPVEKYVRAPKPITNKVVK